VITCRIALFPLSSWASCSVAVAFTARPYVDWLLFAATEPRPVEARGSLADAERTSVDIFQRASPSVVQVVGRTALGGRASLGGRGRAATSGSGFVWDAAGNVVTNNHVVEGVQTLRVRLASGKVAQGEKVGTAPNYDLAVIRISGGATLPYWTSRFNQEIKIDVRIGH